MSRQYVIKPPELLVLRDTFEPQQIDQERELRDFNILMRAVLGEKAYQLKSYHDIPLLSQVRSKEELAKFMLEVPESQAEAVVALAEMGRKYFDRSGRLPRMRTAEDVYKHFSLHMLELGSEQLRVLILSETYQLLYEFIIAMGDLDIMHIDPMEIFHPVVVRKLHNVVLVHNHPSGDPTPSGEDMELTKRIKAGGRIVGVDLLDHVIIARGGYRSCMDELD